MYILIAIYGLLIGSFLGVCISRIPEGKSIVRPPSHCEACGHQLNFLDMIPVISYIFTKGKCRYCGDKLSPKYPLLEILTGVMFIALYAVYGLTITFVYYSIMGSLLIVITFIDYKHMIIPTGLIIFGLIAIVIYFAIANVFPSEYITVVPNFKDSLFGGLIGYGLFFVIVITTGAMGGGDVRLMGILGLAFGIEGVVFITIVSFILGALISLILLATKIKSWKDMIPFGPFISGTALIYILYGKELIINYLALFVR